MTEHDATAAASGRGRRRCAPRLPLALALVAGGQATLAAPEPEPEPAASLPAPRLTSPLTGTSPTGTSPTGTSPTGTSPTGTSLDALVPAPGPATATSGAPPCPDPTPCLGGTGSEANTDLSGPFIQLGGHMSLFSDVAGRSLLAGTFGYSGRGGWRFGQWGVFLQVEHSLWLTSELEREVVNGVVNLGVGGEYAFADGFVRTAVSGGPSILVFDTPLDGAGSTGLFVDIRPLGLRWPLYDRLVLGLDPLGFSLVAPVLEGIPLVQISYRSSLYVEWRP